MPNLVKIDTVVLYTDGPPSGGVPATVQPIAARNLLNSNGIPFQELWYQDNTQWQSVFDSLNTWTFGPPSAPVQRTFTAFPFVHWIEYYDDFSRHLGVAIGLTELSNSSLIANKGLVAATVALPP